MSSTETIEDRLTTVFASEETMRVVLEKLDEHLSGDDRLRIIADQGMQRMFEEAGHWPVGTIRAVKEAASGRQDFVRFVSLAIDLLPEAARLDVLSTLDKVAILPTMR